MNNTKYEKLWWHSCIGQLHNSRVINLNSLVFIHLTINRQTTQL